MKKFTIITPVYNGGPFIGETIDSVLSVCKGQDFEYIVVNDGSIDATAEVLSKYAEQILVVTQKNQGEAAAVNKGLMMGTGEYAIVVSADDPMRSSKLLNISKEVLDGNREIVCVYPDWSIIDSKSNIIQDVLVSEYSEEKLIGEFNCIVGPGGVFRREAALQIGGRDIRYRFTSDYEFWLRLSRIGKFKRIPGFFAYWREHGASTSIAFRGLEMALERIDVIENFTQNQNNLPKKLKKMAKGHSYMQGALLIFFDRRIPAKRWLARSLFFYPRGVLEFDLSSMLYIILFPFSANLLTFLKRIGRYRNLPNHA